MPPFPAIRDDSRVLFRFFVAVAVLAVGASVRISLHQRTLAARRATVDLAETEAALRDEQATLRLKVATLASAPRLLSTSDPDAANVQGRRPIEVRR